MITNYITIDGVTTQADLEDEKGIIDSDVASLLRDDEKIPLNKLAKYYLNENLNFLCGSGTSASIGGKTINKGVNPFDSIIAELKTISTPKEHIIQLIRYFESADLLEKKFDKINQEYLYYLNNKEDSTIANEIKTYLDKALKIFVDNYV
ncbi:MAG: hypothetical protein PHI54_05760, partial [Bacteroidales bacterium]|nr:hypothetical protein [Bacteroidales bacterium]